MNLRTAAVIFAIVTVLAVIILNFDALFGTVEKAVSILAPFIFGFIVAYIVNILMSLIESKIWKKTYKKKYLNMIKRIVCMIISFAVFLGIIIVIIYLIVPQIIKSALDFADDLPAYFSELQSFAVDKMSYLGISVDDLTSIRVDWQSLIAKLTDILGNLSGTVFSVASEITSAIFNGIMGMFFAIYILLGKESLKSGYHRFVLAFFPKKAKTIFHVSSLTNETFRNFALGQLIECMVLAIMYWIGMTVFGLEYAVLISFIMAIGGIIPQFGPIFAAIPSAFILLLANPTHALIFIIMCVVIQQLEGNIIFPHIVGDKVGLPGIWCLLAVLIGGGIYGVIGMIVSVPTASVVYRLCRDKIVERLDGKEAVTAEKSAAPEKDENK